MQVLNEKALARFCRKHAGAADWLGRWLTVARAAQWHKIQDVKTAFPAADGGVKVRRGGSVTVFDVRGNKYRLIAAVIYPAQVVTILDVLTHAEYPTDRWKQRY